MTRNLLRRLDSRNKRIQELQDQLSSGRAIRKASDDPVAATKAFRLRTTLAEVERYRRNLEDAREWVSATEGALEKMTEALQKARELAVQAATSSVPQSSLEAIAQELEQLQEHLVALANSDHGGRYLFAGQKTLTAPFDMSGPTGPLDTGAITREIAPGQVMQINITGEFLAGAGSVLGILPDLVGRVRAADHTAVSSMISTVQEKIDQVLSLQAETGAKINRIEMSVRQLSESETSLSRLLSETEDADMALLVVHLAQEEAAYRAALQVGARLVEPTLVDFLR
jgi:flagellar hook-associated protein 3 FlgL